MKIAISTDQGKVSAHFGRCPQFTIIEIKDSQLIDKKTIDNPGHHPGFLPEYLQKAGVSAIIAGGMGKRAEDLFRQAKIDTIMGIEGDIEQVIDQIKQGTIEGKTSICKPGKGKGYGIPKENLTEQ